MGNDLPTLKKQWGKHLLEGADDPGPLQDILGRLFADQHEEMLAMDVNYPVKRTALHFTAEVGHIKILSWLLSSTKAVVDAQDSHGCTPFWVACQCAKLTCAQALLERGADKNKANASGWRPLHTAVFHRNRDVVAFLIEQHVELSAGTKRTESGVDAGSTPLDIAIAKGYEELATQLRAAGALTADIKPSAPDKSELDADNNPKKSAEPKQ